MTASSPQPPEILKLLAHNLRWRLLQTLTLSDCRVQELTTFVDEPMNLVSYHLKKLRSDGIVTTRRSEADARDIYYTLDVGKLRALYQAAGVALHPAMGGSSQAVTANSLPSKRILFVCTHNSARSQMAEALMRRLGGNQLEVYSAGSHPTRLHADTIRTMDSLGIDIRSQHPKHISEFEGQDFDYVITVCDKAREVCPTFPGQGTQIHWGFADPATVEDVKDRRRAFDHVAQQLTTRIEYFLTTISHEE